MIELLILTLVVILLGLLSYWSLSIKQKLRAIDVSIAAVAADHWHSALLLRNFPKDMLPGAPNGWAAGSDLLVELSKIVRARQPTYLVELGSGLSTLVLGLELKRQGSGKLISVEHDPDYAAQTKSQIEAAGLAEYVEVRIAQLKTEKAAAAPWYDPRMLEDIERVDLVFVDGPPGMLAPRIREQALPFFWPRLITGGQIVFDDANRPDEKAFIDQWSASRMDCSVQWLSVAKGCAVIQRLR